MKRAQYKALREKLYKLAGEIGTYAELYGEKMPELDSSYYEICHSLDFIDKLGVDLGFINPETNEYIDKRFKKLN